MRDTEYFEGADEVKWDYKSANDKNILKGIASTFGGEPDLGGDIVDQGAFTKTLAQRVNKKGIPLADTHRLESEHILGKVVSGEETKTQLKTTAIISEAPSAQEVKTKMLEGMISGLSIGYHTVKQSYSQYKGEMVRHLEEVKLVEISVVATPMNEKAHIVTVKSLPFMDLPLAAVDTPWLPAEAKMRIKQMENTTVQQRAFALFDRMGDTLDEACDLQIADLIDGELKIIPKALHAASLRIIRGEENVQEAKAHLERYYLKLNEVPPWAHSKSLEEVLLEAKSGVVDEARIRAALDDFSHFVKAGTVEVTSGNESSGDAPEPYATEEMKTALNKRMENMGLKFNEQRI